MPGNSSNILLIGGGHAHVEVLADWIKHGVPVERATLLTPEPTLRYSGMVPGWISGEYAKGAGLVDLAGLARAAGVDLVLDACVAFDPEANCVLTRASGVLSFDTVSINTGGVGRARHILGDDPRIIDVRPIHRFVERFDTEAAHAQHIAIVGAGAGGVEVAFAVRNRSAGAPPRVTVIAGQDGLVPDLSKAVQRKVAAEMKRQGIAVIAADARLSDGNLMARDTCIEADCIIAALGSGAPDWPRLSAMDCDLEGFIAVDAHQRSISHPHVFAVGDIAARMDRPVPHSGVHAVFAAPILAENLRSAVAGEQPGGVYRPRWQNLYLLSTGRGQAIASYGSWAAQGRWVSWLKGWIDKRWIDTYAKLARAS